MFCSVQSHLLHTDFYLFLFFLVRVFQVEEIHKTEDGLFEIQVDHWEPESYIGTIFSKVSSMVISCKSRSLGTRIIDR